MKQLHQQIPKGDKIWLVGVSTGRYKEILLMNLQQNHKKMIHETLSIET